jgi:4a-hydroxytetrahydrobiopterin dehydratase
MPLMSEQEITAELRKLTGWSLAGKEIRRAFELKDFAGAMEFVRSVALLAEKANHHPDIDIRWNTVTLTLSTHSAGGLTMKDFTLASEINSL